MPGRPPPNPERVRDAQARRASGATVREAAEALDVSVATVRLWCRAYDSEGHPLPVGDSPSESPEDASDPLVDSMLSVTEVAPPPPDDAPALEQIQHLYRSMLRMAADANDLGNATAAQRHLTAAAKLAPTIARLEREQRAGGDAIVIPRARYDALVQQYRETVEAYRARPLTCSHCGRALRMRAAGVS